MRSCETTTIIRCCHVSEVESSRASQSTAPMDRWLVGSSSSSRSGLAKTAAEGGEAWEGA
eukprot:689140-Prymnesium_polylepis.2